MQEIHGLCCQPREKRYRYLLTTNPRMRVCAAITTAETKRIVDAGGFVEYGRVNGNLALSRAIGDFDFKKNEALPAEQQIVTANPDIIERQLEVEDEFIVLACDGIYNLLIKVFGTV